jgi:hypothetical protein
MGRQEPSALPEGTDSETYMGHWLKAGLQWDRLVIGKRGKAYEILCLFANLPTSISPTVRSKWSNTEPRA